MVEKVVCLFAIAHLLLAVACSKPKYVECVGCGYSVCMDPSMCRPGYVCAGEPPLGRCVPGWDGS